MKIAAKYSHLNGFEWLMAHRPKMWSELVEVVEAIDAEAYRTKKSLEKTKYGSMLFNPAELNSAFRDQLYAKEWERPGTISFYATDDADLMRRTMNLDHREQKKIIEESGKRAIYSSNQADFYKERVSLEVQFGKYSFVQFDIFVKHAANYMQDRIDLGIEIVPTKKMEEKMSSGPPYYEKHLHEIVRQGRIFPPVPLVLIGIEP